jgi:hypothetical protein
VLKWILLLVGVGLIYFWIKNKGRAAQVEKAKAQTPPPVIAESEEIRPCRHCGVHLPSTEGVMHEDRFYCSSAHRDAID